jgi:hypothetical protein
VYAFAGDDGVAELLVEFLLLTYACMRINEMTHVYLSSLSSDIKGYQTQSNHNHEYDQMALRCVRFYMFISFSFFFLLWKMVSVQGASLPSST